MKERDGQLCHLLGAGPHRPVRTDRERCLDLPSVGSGHGRPEQFFPPLRVYLTGLSRTIPGEHGRGPPFTGEHTQDQGRGGLLPKDREEWRLLRKWPARCAVTRQSTQVPQMSKANRCRGLQDAGLAEPPPMLN